MAGYLGTKAALLSTTAADVVGNAEIGGDLTVGGTVTADGLTVDNGVSSSIRIAGNGNNAVNTEYATLEFYNNDPSTAGPNVAASIKAISTQSTGSGAAMVFGTTTGSEAEGTPAIERLRIDSSGRVTMPYQPAFYGAYTGVNVSWANNQTFGWNIVHMNVGNHFNGGTGRFTAPVAGVYSFNYNAWASSGPTQVCFKINGTDWKPTGADTQGIANLASTDGQRTGGATLVIPLSAGDYVHVGMRTGFADTIYMGHSHFSGYLIG